MKNLAIIAYSRKAVNEYRNLFEKILENRVLISTYCMEDGSIYQPIQADLAVISSDDMLPLAKKQLASGITLVTAALTISRKGFEAIQALPPGTRALSFLIDAFTEPSDKGIIQSPVYYPFARSVRTSGRTFLDNPLIIKDGRYQMDLESLEAHLFPDSFSGSGTEYDSLHRSQQDV